MPIASGLAHTLEGRLVGARAGGGQVPAAVQLKMGAMRAGDLVRLFD